MSQTKPLSTPYICPFPWPLSLAPIEGNRNQEYLQLLLPPYYYIQSHSSPVISTCIMSSEFILFSLSPWPPTIVAFLVVAIASQSISLNLFFLQPTHAPKSSLSNHVLR